MHHTPFAFRSTMLRPSRHRANQEQPADDDMVDTVVTASPASRTRRSTHPLIDIGMVPRPEFSTHGSYLPRGIPTDTPPASPSREHSSVTRHDNESRSQPPIDTCGDDEEILDLVTQVINASPMTRRRRNTEPNTNNPSQAHSRTPKGTPKATKGKSSKKNSKTAGIIVTANTAASDDLNIHDDDDEQAADQGSPWMVAKGKTKKKNTKTAGDIAKPTNTDMPNTTTTAAAAAADIRDDEEMQAAAEDDAAADIRDDKEMQAAAAAQHGLQQANEAAAAIAAQQANEAAAAIGNAAAGAGDTLNPLLEGPGNYEEYIPLPLIDEEEIDRLTMQLGLSDWTIVIAPADKHEYQEDPDSFRITTHPMKGEFLKQLSTKLMDNHGVNTRLEGRSLKIVSMPNSKPPWRAHLRLLNDDNAQDIIKDFTTNGLQVPQYPQDTVTFVLDMSPSVRSSQMTDHIGYMAKWGHHMHVTQSMIDHMINDFDSRIPVGFPKILTKAEDGTATYTGHWEVSRATTPGYDVKSGMRMKTSDTAMVFLVSKQSLIDHTGGINRHLAAPPYVYMPVIEANEGKLVKLDIDIMGWGYCKGNRTTHDEARKDSPDDDYSEKDTCVYCVREFNTDRQRLQPVNRCRNLFCRIKMGIKALDPKAYETFRTNHDCVLDKRKEEGTMMDYALPPIPQVETKKWAQTTPNEMLQTQLSSELKKDKDRKEASAEEARQIRQAAATAQADRQARPPPTRRNEDHQAKKRKTFGGYKKWPA